MPLLEQVLEKYPKEVRVVFKNFPLRNHKFARRAATAALAAMRQGKFWQFHDGLFENFNRLNEEKIRAIAHETGLDMELFDRGMKDPAVGALINRDVKDGTAAGVRGTPTIFINGRRLKDRSLKGFQALIDEELGQAGSK